MATLEELMNTYAREFALATAGLALLGEKSEKRQWVEKFLSNNGFTDLTFIAHGGSSIVLGDARNPDIAMRIASTQLRPGEKEAKRAQIPQIIQPLHVETMPNHAFHIEILRNIAIPESTTDETLGVMMADYRQEMKLSAYPYQSDCLARDVGEFRYTDSRSGKKKSVIMGADPGLVTDRDVGNKPPTCTAAYPTLQDQWREQCRIVDADSRLKKLIGIPKELPATKVISILERSVGC